MNWYLKTPLLEHFDSIMIRELPEDYRNVLLERFHGNNYVSIAKEMGLSWKMVRCLETLAKRELTKKMLHKHRCKVFHESNLTPSTK